jgi:signal transduction histidine kinase/CheY-like chemotaxis protein
MNDLKLSSISARSLLKGLINQLVTLSSTYLVISIIILLLGIFTYSALKKRFISQKSNEISSIAELKVEQLADFRQRRINDGRFFFGNQSFIGNVSAFILKRDSASQKVLEDWLTPILNDQNYDAVFIIDPKTRKSIFGRSNEFAFIEENISAADMQCMESDSICFGNFFIHQNDSAIHLNIYVPLLLQSQSPIEKIAVLKLVINPYNQLYGLMQSMPNKGKTGEVLMVKKEGTDVLYLNELRFKENAALRFRLPLSSKDLPAAKALLGDEEVAEGIDYRGQKVLAISRLIPGTVWSIVVKFDIDEINAEFETITILVSGMVVLLLIASALGFTFAQGRKKLIQFSSRIKDLTTIQRLSHVYKLLVNIEHAIVKHNDRENLLNEVCHIVVSEKDYLLCWVGIINNRIGHIEIAAQCGIEPEYIQSINTIQQEKIGESSFPALKAIISGKSFVSNNIWNDPAMEEWREKGLSPGFNSIAVFPLIQNEKTTGALFFYADRIGYFIDDEIRLLDRLCKDLSYALDKIELEKKEKRATEKLLEKDSKLMQQNTELMLLNEKYVCTNDELKKLNERLEKINLELDKARKYAEESNRLKSTFLANMSHEIRTPMNAVIGFAELLQHTRLNDSTREEYCQVIVERSHDLLQIINDILDISKIDSHTVTLFIDSINLNDFIDELHLIYLNKLGQVNKTHINLSHKRPKDQLILATDELKLRQIFTNLLDNAIKFTDKGEIKFGYHDHSDDELTFFVSDTGIGIDQKHQKKIFDIFTQADHNSNKSYGGTGLGLAICKGNAHLLGGDVSVESGVGNGSIFYFTIKYNKGTPLQTLKELYNQESDRQWASKDILLVEDDIYSVEYMKHLLLNTGIKLHIARSGSELEEYYKRLKDIDLVLMDIRLPDANGFDLMTQLKILNKELPVIAQTAFAMEDDKAKCLEAGFDGYISKPFKRKEILSLINSYIVARVSQLRS